MVEGHFLVIRIVRNKKRERAERFEQDKLVMIERFSLCPKGRFPCTLQIWGSRKTPQWLEARQMEAGALRYEMSERRRYIPKDRFLSLYLPIVEHIRKFVERYYPEYSDLRVILKHTKNIGWWWMKH